jgi:hypothetical protein
VILLWTELDRFIIPFSSTLILLVLESRIVLSFLPRWMCWWVAKFTLHYGAYIFVRKGKRQKRVQSGFETSGLGSEKKDAYGRLYDLVGLVRLNKDRTDR